MTVMSALRWRRNGHGGVSNHQPHHCLLNRLFGCRSKKTSKLRVTGLCAGNSPGTGEFPAQMASNAENVSIWWHHHGLPISLSLWVCRRHSYLIISMWISHISEITHDGLWWPHIGDLQLSGVRLSCHVPMIIIHIGFMLQVSFDQ